MPTPEPRPAATVVVLRPSDQGPEVLLLKRSRKVGFFPRAWVFPGGRLDPEDHTLPHTGITPGLDATLAPYAVAALRECFEECGLWLGRGTPHTELRSRLLDTRAGIVAEDGLVADLSQLRHWAWWVTPEAEKRRYDTRFFLARVSRAASEHARADARETVADGWFTPADALDRARAGSLFVAPPTWRTLQELAPFSSLDDLWRHAEQRAVPRVQPVIESRPEGPAILLPGHPLHPEPTPPGHEAWSRAIVWRDGRWHDEATLTTRQPPKER